jgi:hypothetical protein
VLIGDTFAPQQPSYPLVCDGRDESLLQAICLELTHRPLRERQAEVFGTAQRDANEGSHRLAIDDDRPAGMIGLLLKAGEAAVVEAMDPVLGFAVAAAHCTRRCRRRHPVAHQVDDAVALVDLGRQALLAESLLQGRGLTFGQRSQNNSSGSHQRCSWPATARNSIPPFYSSWKGTRSTESARQVGGRVPGNLV